MHWINYFIDFFKVSNSQILIKMFQKIIKNILIFVKIALGDIMTIIINNIAPETASIGFRILEWALTIVIFFTVTSLAKRRREIFGLKFLNLIIQVTLLIWACLFFLVNLLILVIIVGKIISRQILNFGLNEHLVVHYLLIILMLITDKVRLLNLLSLYIFNFVWTFIQALLVCASWHLNAQKPY